MFFNFRKNLNNKKNFKEWKPRYGYRSAPNDKVHKDWLIEIPRQKGENSYIFLAKVNYVVFIF